MKAMLLLMLLSTGIFSQVPNTFQAGTPAKASEVNENFTYLVNKIDSLMSLIDTFKQESSAHDSLITGLSNLSDSAYLKISNNALSIGTVMGLMNPLDSNSEMWVLADGRTATTEYFQVTGKSNIPDLRGMFLRGLNAGRVDGLEDPEGIDRVPASYQADLLKAHSHLESLAVGAMGVHGGGSWGAPNVVQTGITGGVETRPKNVAVYWYIKVK